MITAIRNNLGTALIVLCACAEPVCHALAIPHPEGLQAFAQNALASGFRSRPRV